jgi:hypothetical protein
MDSRVLDISGYFVTACVDVQKQSPRKSGIGRSGLLDAMNTMNIVDRPSRTNSPTKRLAINSAVRCLAALAEVIGLDSFASQAPYAYSTWFALQNSSPK